MLTSNNSDNHNNWKVKIDLEKNLGLLAMIEVKMVMH